MENSTHIDQLFTPVLTNLSDEENNETSNIHSSATVLIQPDEHTFYALDDDTTNTTVTYDEIVSLSWALEPYIFLNSTIHIDYNPMVFNTTATHYDVIIFHTNVSEYENIDQDITDHEEDMKNDKDIPIISNDDVNMIANNFYLRKKEMEHLSYPYPNLKWIIFLWLSSTTKGHQTCNNHESRHIRFKKNRIYIIKIIFKY